MKVLFWGTPSYSVPVLNELVEKGYNVIGVVTQPDKRRGRGKNICYSKVKQRAIELSIPVYTPYSLKEENQVKDELIALKADVYVVVAYGKILPTELLNVPRLGCWNCHASILPEWRGAAPIQWSIIKGDKETGVCIMLMNEGLDTGPVLIEEKVTILFNDNAESLSNKLSLLSSKLIIQALNQIKTITTNLDKQEELINSLALKPQDNDSEKVSYARMINKKDFIINWNDTAIQIHRKIMGLYPNGYTFINNKRLKIVDSVPISNNYIDAIPQEIYNYYKSINFDSTEPGTFLKVFPPYGIVCSSTQDLILIKSAQLEGKQIMSGNQMISQLEKYKGRIFSNTMI